MPLITGDEAVEEYMRRFSIETWVDEELVELLLDQEIEMDEDTGRFYPVIGFSSTV
jgi:hypothetical protein